MTSNSAPSPDFTGIDFNDMFFPSAVGDYVDYPVAQGPVSFGSLYASFIDVISSSSSFSLLNSLTGNLDIATNGTSGQTLRLGAYTNASIHVGNIDHQNQSINNATNASGGLLNICNNQTTGSLNIGTNATRTGNINIGTLGTTGGTGGINLGGAGYNTTVNGPLLMNACYLTGTTPTLTKTSLNYFVNYANVLKNTNALWYLYAPTSNTSTADTHYLNPGIYVVDIKMAFNEAGGPTAIAMTYTMGVSYSNITGALNTAGQAGTVALSSIPFTPTLFGKNGIAIGYSYTGCFTLASASYVNLQVIINGTVTGGTVTVTLNGCIRRIA